MPRRVIPIPEKSPQVQAITQPVISDRKLRDRNIQIKPLQIKPTQTQPTQKQKKTKPVNIQPNIVEDNLNLTTEEIYEEMYKQVPKKATQLFTHFQISEPNFMHQVDTLYLPHDGPYKYALTLVDVASRYKASRPLKTKESSEAFQALMDIYKTDKYLKIPKELNSDKGSEFENKIFKDWASKNSIILKYNDPSWHLAMVEAFNKNLAKLLFKNQTIEEIDTGEVNRKWVKVLQKTVDKMNNTTTRMIQDKPISAIQKDIVLQPKNKFSSIDTSKSWPVGTIVRRVLNPDEILEIPSLKIKVGKHRTTDPTYSFELYEVISISQHCDTCLKYHKIRNKSTQKDFNHLFTYYQLFPTKVKVEEK